MMENRFDPAAVEARIASNWEAEGAFKANRPDRVNAPPYCIVIPPPNVTGSLHMGHALNNTLQDILCRYERLRGKNVLWQPGTDHAGIATQMVVERQLAERKEPGRRDMGRERFLERVWEWKAESGGTIVNQLKRLGASCDWSRERFTMDEGLSRAVRKVFVQLYRDGLIYRDKRLVNWDPKLLTAISDLEVQQIEVKGHLWHFKYPIIDAAGTLTGESIIVATTRPETMLGDTAVAVHPENEKLGHLIGKMIRLPLVGRLIPIVGDDYADPEKGTGAVKITPAHDFNDFEVGRRHNLPLVNILDVEGRMDLADNAAFLDHVPPSEELQATIELLHGLDRAVARKRVVEAMEMRELLDKIEPHTHMVPHGDRSNVVIEPYLTDQWYVDAKTLAQPALAAVREGRTNFIPKNWDKTYFEWLENIQPWCISRQLWWGHQIPAWYASWGSVYVAETEAEAIAQALADGVERQIYSADQAEQIAKDQSQWAQLLTRDEDVLDTWFSSALWPFSTLGWPDATHELSRFYPTSVLVTGFDIIFFWVARMMMMGLYFMKAIPFKDVYIHALVRDEKGAKMSKSKGNVIDPLDLVEKYGADALRFTLTAMAAQGRDIKLATQRVEGYRNFATKLWNAARFAEMNGCARVESFHPKDVKETLNRWILGEAARAQREIETALAAYRFNDSANAAYRFVWNIFCDWYLELAKPVLQGQDSAAKQETRATTAYVLDQILILLHPFMPFITEELWAIKGQEGPARSSLLVLSQWPDLSGLENDAVEAEIGWIVDLVSEIRSVRSEMNVPASAQIPLVLVAPGDEVEARVQLWDETIRRLARLSDISFAAAAPAGSAQLIIRSVVAALPLKGIIDLEAERQRLTKDIQRLNSEIIKIDSKLNNVDFVRRAPEEVVEENRERRAEMQAQIGKITAALEWVSQAG